jgi:uncharacterized protein YcbK (DUF882 family)
VKFAHWSEVPDEIWTWANFTAKEIASKGDGSVVIVPDALDALSLARETDGEPFRILSAYRDPIHNAKVGGAPLSRHKFGDAFDIALSGHDRDALREACRLAGFRGFGLYKTFLHVDLGPRREWGKWTS